MSHDIRLSGPSPGHAGPFEAWQRGLTLAQALDRFANGATGAERRSRVEARFDRLRTDPRNPLANRAEAMVHLQDLARAWEEQARLLEELRAHLIGMLHAGRLLAIGFTVETGSSSRLAIVPWDVWATAIAIDWDGSGIQGKDTAFLDVRILPPDQDRLKHPTAAPFMDPLPAPDV